MSGDGDVVDDGTMIAGCVGGVKCRRVSRRWRGVTATVEELHGGGSIRRDIDPGDAALHVVLETVGRSTDIRVASAAVERQNGVVSFVPADSPAMLYGERTRYLRHLILRFDRSLIAKFDEDADRLCRPRLMFAEPRLEALARLIAEACLRDEVDRHYGESLSLAALLVLVRGAEPPAGGSAGNLAPWQIRRVEAYIEANLNRRIAIGELAAAAQLSSSHFRRAFKKAAGTSPRRAILAARIRHAMRLMLEGGECLAALAVEVGFADQSHLARHFKRMVGENPSAWRRRHAREP